MKVIFVKKAAKKLLAYTAVLALWLFVLTVSLSFMEGTAKCRAAIEGCFSFTHQVRFHITDVLINTDAGAAIETDLMFDAPLFSGFSGFESLEGKFKFEYPADYILDYKSFPGSEILYHLDFRDRKNGSIHGFIQVWRLPYGLSDFLENSQKTSNQNYKYFSSKPVKLEQAPAYHWDYAVYTADGSIWKGSEVFFKYGDRMYRISMFMPENLWNYDMSKIYWDMVRSFKAT